MKKGLIYIIAMIFLCSCCDKPNTEESRRSVLVYIAANNTLSSYTDKCISDIESGYVPYENDYRQVLLVFVHKLSGEPTLYRYYKTKDNKVKAAEVAVFESTFNSAMVESFKRVVAAAEQAYPSKYHNLVLWSHSTGWLPSGYFSHPTDLLSASPMSFGEDHGYEMDIMELADAVADNFYDLVIFDSCLMGCVEVAYQFKDKSRYMIFSPTEILAEGMPYISIIEKCFAEPSVKVYGEICYDYFHNYDIKSGIYRSATISLVDCSALPLLASACKTIFENNREAMSNIDRTTVQGYYRFNKAWLNKYWFFDFEDYVSKFANAGQMAKFSDAIGKAVPVKYHTDKFIDLDIKTYSGMSVYIPDEKYKNLNDYYRNLAWNKATALIPTD